MPAKNRGSTSRIEESLTTEQSAVLAALLEGRSITEAAQMNGVSRSTVHRWLKDDSTFMAALNSARRVFVEEHRSQLMPLFDAAISAVRDGIERGDAKLALSLLQRMGVLAFDPESAPERPEDVEFAAEAKSLERRFKLGKLMSG